MSYVIMLQRKKLLYCITAMLLSLPQALHAQTVRIILNDWASQHVISHIYSQLLSKVNIDSKFVPLPTDGQWYYLKYNYVDVQVEVWQGTMEDKLAQLIASNDLQEAGSYPIETREDWWYPSYVELLCPKLPDWQALNDCAHLFSKGDDPRGVYYTGPWEKNDHARVRALGLNYRIESLPDDAALVTILKQAYKLNQPVLLFNWTPNWVDVQYQGQFVDFPAYAPECETKPEWGMNKQFLHDCGNPATGWIKKVAAKEFPKALPCAFSILENMTFNSSDLAQFALQVNQQSQSSEQVSIDWLQHNPTRWQHWLTSPSCDNRR